MQETHSHSDQSEEAGAYFFGTVVECNENSDAWFVKLNVGGSNVKFKVDTGADLTIMSSKTFEQLPEKTQLIPTTVKMLSPGGKLKCKGEFRAHTVFRNIEYSFRVVVLKGEETSNLLARSVSEKMGLVIHAEEISREIFDSGGLLKTSSVKI